MLIYAPFPMKHPFFQKFLFCAAAVASGWIAAFAMSPVSQPLCLFAGFSALYGLYARTQNAGQAFITGFLFALGYFVTGLWWIGNALLVEGNEFAWVWPISVIGLPTLLGLFTGTYLAIARMIAPANTLRGFVAFSFFLTFSEWARGHAFTGFPWNLYGYVWADHLAMAQAAHYIGAYGLTFVSVLWAALAGFLFVAKRNIPFNLALGGAAFITIVGTFSMGQLRLDNGVTELDRKNGIVVVQPNIPQNMKWDPVAVQDNFLKIVSLSKGANFAEPKPDNVFIVWPETAISPPVYTIDANMERLRDMLAAQKDTNTYLVTGILRRKQDGDDVSYANSIVIMDEELSALDVYDKFHLVPFGEFIPLQKWIPLTPVAAFKGFDRGVGARTISREGLPPFSPLICYEVIFPGDVTANSGERAQWIVNATNDGWYGDSAGPYQHFAQTRLRAIEEGLPVIRAANTGVSGIIDPYGRVMERADIFQEAVLVSYLPRPLLDTRPVFPSLFGIFLPIASIFLMGWLLPRRKQP